MMVKTVDSPAYIDAPSRPLAANGPTRREALRRRKLARTEVTRCIMIFPNLTAEEDARRRALYDLGLSDLQIAKDLGRNHSTIQRWRVSRGLPAHFLQGAKSKRCPETVAMTTELKVLFQKLLRRNVGARLIAREWGVSSTTLDLWRSEMLAAEPSLRRPATAARLRPRYPSGRLYSRMIPERRRRAFELYADGLSDQEIAVAMGINRQMVGEWRNAFFLQPNIHPGWADYARKRRPGAPNRLRLPPPTPITPRSNPIYALIADAIGRGIAPDIADDAISDMWVALEEGRITADEIAAAAKSFRNKVVRCFASTFGPSSLDEVVQGTDDLRMIDMIRDDRSSSWLEEMGATVW